MQMIDEKTTCAQCVHCRKDGDEHRCWGIPPTLCGDSWWRTAPIETVWPACSLFRPKLNG